VAVAQDGDPVPHQRVRRHNHLHIYIHTSKRIVISSVIKIRRIHRARDTYLATVGRNR
jgi:rRNA pseudouridine-1189 N-methylase Emg1 (Nep1/Mra1 family)